MFIIKQHNEHTHHTLHTPHKQLQTRGLLKNIFFLRSIFQLILEIMSTPAEVIFLVISLSMHHSDLL